MNPLRYRAVLYTPSTGGGPKKVSLQELENFLGASNVKGTLKINDRELELGLIGSKKSWHDKYKDSAWIFIGGLPYDLSEGDIICVFSQYGEIVNINLVRDQKTGKSKGFAFACFEDQRSTILSVDNLNGAKLLGRTLRVDHVENYKVPKDKDDIDPVTKKLRDQGCAPKLPDSEPEEEVEEKPVVPVRVKEEPKEERSKHKKSKKKKKKKKYSESESSSADSDSSEDYRKKRKKSKGHDRKKSELELRVKKEKKTDKGYKKYDQVGAFSSDENSGDSSRGRGRWDDERFGRKGSFRDSPVDRDRSRRDERERFDRRRDDSRERWRSKEKHRRSRSRSRERRRERSTSRDRKRNRSRSRERYRR